MPLPLAPPESEGFSGERLTRISQLMDRYVRAGTFAGMVACVARHGRIVYFEPCGFQDLQAGTPMARDTIFRICSMTKPITSVALMMLYEESLFNLSDPVSKFIPAFGKVKLLADDGRLVQPDRPVTIHDLLCHTAGLSYGDFASSGRLVDQLYDEADLSDPALTNQEITTRLATLPLLFQPGTRWHYSMATDVAGHLVELISGLSLADFMAQKIFTPLGMVDTAFHIEPAKLDRFATLYGKTPGEDLGLLDEPASSIYLPPVITHSGGAGLLSTAADYLRFAQCMLNQGELEGATLLGPRTVAMMACNHLPAALLPIAFEGMLPVPGMGFGLGFGVMLEPARAGMMGSPGDHGWGGYAETYFWIDPREEMVAIQMTQYRPSQTYPIREEFRAAVYQALLD